MSELSELYKLLGLFRGYSDSWKRDATNPHGVKPQDVWDAAAVEVQRSIKELEDANG